jgi:hypothetical protein
MNERLFASVLAVVLSVACSPKNVGGVDAGVEGGTSVEQACADSAYARCTRFQTCSQTVLSYRYGDVNMCEAVFKGFCLANLAAPSTGQTPDGVEACAQRIPNWDCNDYIFTLNPPPECQEADGSLANGAGCAFAAQCQSGFCAITPGAACGECAPTPAVGASCAQLTSCGLGQECNIDSLTCDLPAAPMASCAPGQACVVGYECVGLSTANDTPGTCQPAVESTGGACSQSTAECDFYAGLTCNNQTKQCAVLQLAGAAAPCNYVSGSLQETFCSAGAKCNVPTGSLQGTCTGSSSLGGPCDLVAGPTCIAPSRCIVASDAGTSGTCQVSAGTACQ